MEVEVCVVTDRWARRRPARAQDVAMTSHFLDRVRTHDKRRSDNEESDCIFCDIIARKQPAYIVAETDDYMAFLDGLPIRAGVLG